MAGLGRSVLLTSMVTLALFAGFATPVEVRAQDPAPEGRYIVGFHEWPGLREGDRYAGGTVVKTLETIRAAVLRPDGPSSDSRAAEDPNVRYVEPDAALPVLVDFTPNDPRFGDQYGPQQVKAPAAWDRTLGTTARVICVVDTGVRSTHEDIAGPRWMGGRNTVSNNNNVADDNGHGTHVTGIAAAGVHNGKGIAGVGNVGIKHVKALNSAGGASVSGLADGVRWCGDNGTHVTSNSWGDPSICSFTSIRDSFDANQAKGLVNFAAAGNGFGAAIECPARWASVVAVTCTTSSKNGCSFSSRGPEAELAAPGDGIVAPCFGSDTQYCTKSGTSMSTPYAAGVATLAWSFDATVTGAQLRTFLQQTAEDRGTAGRDSTYGFGIVDADQLMQALNDPPVANAGPDVTRSDADGTGSESVTLSGAASSDPDPGDSIALYEWLRGGAVAATGVSATFDFPVGSETVTLRVTDTRGATGTDTVVVQVFPNQPPTARFSMSCDGLACTFDGTASTDADGALVGHAWDFGDGNVGSGATTAHTYAAGATYTITLTVTDNGGATGQTGRLARLPAVAVVDETFEGGLPTGWATTGFWHVDSLCAAAPSPPNYLGFHRVGACDYDSLRGLQLNLRSTGFARFPVDLSGANFATLTFDHRFEVERTASTAKDLMRVEASANGGATWTLLQQWSSQTPNQDPWAPVEVSLDAFAGQATQVRFWFDSLDILNNGFDGWLVDNVRVVADAGGPGNAPPVASFTATQDLLELSVDGAASLDPDGSIVGWSWDWGDATPPGSGVTAQHTYGASGTYTVTLTVTDDLGATGTTTRTFTVTDGTDPDPTVPNLENGVARADTVQGAGAERFYKIFVPAGRPSLTVVLDGPNCLPLSCNPDLDLYVKNGHKPSDGTWDCRPFESDSDETCTLSNPASGWWYVRVKVFSGGDPGSYTVRASH